MKDFDLAGLVSARICHDLASPLGAVVNGADLIGELPPGDAADELAMVAQSAGRAAALLRFHRLAFGTAGDADTRIFHADLRSRAETPLTSPRVSLEWTAQAGADISGPVARICALIILAALAALGGQGGVVRVRPSLDGDLPLTIQAAGPQARLSDAQHSWLRGDLSEPPQPRQVEFALIAPAAARAGAQIQLTEDTGSVTFRAVPA